MKIAIVEDDLVMQNYLRNLFFEEGFIVSVFQSGEELLRNLKNEFYSILILDVNLPMMNGFDICAVIKKNHEKHNYIKILMLTGKENQEDVIKGLESGADDYLKKPFNEKELVLRVKNLIIRNSPKPAIDLIEYKGQVINFVESIVVVEQERIVLSKREAELLKYLLINKGIILTKEKIYQNVWNESYEAGNKTINVYVSKLKKKLQVLKENLETVKGIGFRLKR